MCGRFIQSSAPQEYAEYFGLELDPQSAGPIRPRYNLAPSQDVLVVRVGADGRRHLVHLTGGWSPPGPRGRTAATP